MEEIGRPERVSVTNADALQNAREMEIVATRAAPPPSALVPHT